MCFQGPPSRSVVCPGLDGPLLKGNEVAGEWETRWYEAHTSAKLYMAVLVGRVVGQKLGGVREDEIEAGGAR